MKERISIYKFTYLPEYVYKHVNVINDGGNNNKNYKINTIRLTFEVKQSGGAYPIISSF